MIKKSTIGFYVYLEGNLIHWSSKKQKVVVRSNIEFEYRYLALVAIEVTWLQFLFKELGIKINDTPVWWCDNFGIGFLNSNPMFHVRTKHIEINVHFMWEKS